MFSVNQNLCIPKGLSLEESFDTEKDRCKAAFIFSILTLQRIRKKCDDHGFVQLETVEMRKVVGKDFKPILDKMLEIGLIERSGKDYSVKLKRSRAYRVSNELHKSGLKGFKVEYRPLIRNINKVVSEAKRERLKLSKKKHCDLFDVKKFKKAYEWVYIDSVLESSFDDGVEKFFEDLEGGRADHWRNCKDFLAMGGFDPYISQTSGRIFYIGCSFFKEARQYIKIRGNETSEIDIACSQPFFVTTLYEDKDSHEKEKERFLKFLEGDFYISINEACGNPYKNRDKTKKACYAGIFFGNEQLMNHIEVSQYLKREFPILYKMIYDIKKNNPNAKSRKLKKKRGNTYFANYLQAKEADCIFSVVEELRKLDILCLTVHDSIIVEKCNKEVAINLMNRIIKEKTGLKPKLKI